MYAINKPNGNADDIFVRFPRDNGMMWIGDKYVDTPIKTWLLEHAVDYGYVDNRLVGAYLTNEDALAFKLKFGL